jgi:hypothetical protein
MISCKECSKEYSNDAKACPNCGARNPNKWSAGTKFLAFIGVLVVLFIAFLAIGAMTPDSVVRSSVATDLCSQSQEAAHYIAAKSASPADVDRVTREVIADQKYPLLGDKVVASIGGMVAVSLNRNTPDEIAQGVHDRCMLSTQQSNSAQ